MSMSWCQHELVSARIGVSTTRCLHELVSARIGVSTTQCQHHSVSARAGVSTNWCQHELVSPRAGVTAARNLAARRWSGVQLALYAIVWAAGDRLKGQSGVAMSLGKKQSAPCTPSQREWGSRARSNKYRNSRRAQALPPAPRSKRMATHRSRAAQQRKKNSSPRRADKMPKQKPR
jgi:hypothetical protein